MTAETSHWFPWYVRDYLGDTTHLTTREHGAYMLLLGSMWIAGGSLPNDQKKLAMIVKMTPREWAKISPTILAFFQTSPTTIRQNRLTKELTRAQQFMESRRKNGKLGGRPPKATANLDETTRLLNGKPSANLVVSENETYSLASANLVGNLDITYAKHPRGEGKGPTREEVKLGDYLPTRGEQAEPLDTEDEIPF